MKTVRFRDARYVGDPINALRIFNTKEVDEIIVLDITATIEDRLPNLRLLSEMATECFMPFAYGGGIKTLEQIRDVLATGAEKVVINSEAAARPELVRAAADRFGSQSVIVSMDVKQNFFGRYEVRTRRGRKRTGLDPIRYAVDMAHLGAGEIFLNSIDRDGTMKGYDLSLIASVAAAVDVPVIACGGAGKLSDFADAIKLGGASAVAAGSMFVFHGRHRAVLISYPSPTELEGALQGGS